MARERGSEASIRALAKEVKVKTIDVGDSWLPLMDKMSSDRPHNVGKTYVTCKPIAH
jgi:hypothetical protein